MAETKRGARKLSKAQREVLERMRDGNQTLYHPRRVGTNASCLLALSRRGLVNTHLYLWDSYKFSLTDVGRAALVDRRP